MKTTGKTRSASGQAQTSIVEHRDPPHDHHLDHDHDHEGRGIVVEGGLYIEKLAGIDTIVLDKTGTLIMGVPEVTGIRVAEGASEHNVLQSAAIAEQHSEHPLKEPFGWKR
jgi:hypothetical protein